MSEFGFDAKGMVRGGGDKGRTGETGVYLVAFPVSDFCHVGGRFSCYFRGCNIFDIDKLSL